MRPALRRVRGIVLLAFVVVAAALVGAAATIDAAEQPLVVLVPTLEALRLDASGCPFGTLLAGRVEGRGPAVGLGPVTGRGGDCIRPTTPSTFAFSHGRFTMITVDGDEIHAVYAGSLVPSPLPLVHLVLGWFVVTGGTGRFADADGSGGIAGIEHLGTGQGVLQMTGTVSRRVAGSS